MPKLRTFLVFALIGPPLGSLIYTLGLIVGNYMEGRTWPGLEESLMVILFTAPFSYVFGLIPALLVALVMVRVPSRSGIRPSALFALTIGLLIGIVFALVFSPGADDSGLGLYGYFGLKVLTCLVPTLICWWLARPKAADASEVSNEAVKQ